MPGVHAPDRRTAPGAQRSEPLRAAAMLQATHLAAAAQRAAPLDGALERFVVAHARPPASLASVKKLVARGNGTGMDTSEGLLFNHTIWGRDRVITAADMLATSPEIARQTILALARLQGVRRRRRSEEEPGKIHNEHRDLVFWNGPPSLRAFFGYVLSPMWGGTRRGYTTYFAADSTPLYVLLVCRYAALDPAILRENVRRSDGSVTTVLESLIEACRWIVGHMTADGLVEAPKRNLLSLPSQTWRDSPTSNFDGDGRMANTADPVAYLDIQMLAMDALKSAAALLRASAYAQGAGAAPHDGTRGRGQDARSPDGAVGHGAFGDLAGVFGERARALAAATLACFWMDDRQYFGFARDMERDGRPRLLTAVQSNAGWLLLSSLFDDLPPTERERYVGGIIRRLFGPDMLTDAGIRGRSLRYSNPHFRNYHENVWPMDTFMIAKGLRRQGFPELAEQLELRLLSTANLLGANYEFVAVDDEGRIVHPALTRKQAAALYPTTAAPLHTEMLPEVNLAWSVTAMLRIKRERTERCRAAAESVAAAPAVPAFGTPAPAAPAHNEWAGALTSEILASIPHEQVCWSTAELLEHHAPVSPLYLSHLSGLRRAARVVTVEGFGGVIPRKLLRDARAKLGLRAR
jgi:glycogen debranching enzyme